MSIQEVIRKNLIFFRKSKKLTQNELAVKMGSSQCYVGAVEAGLRNASLNYIETFCNVLNVEFYKIFLIEQINVDKLKDEPYFKLSEENKVHIDYIIKNLKN